MRDAVIVEAVRTPVGKRQGRLASVHPTDLSAVVLEALLNRAGLDPGVVEDVVWGCVSQIGEQTYNIGRNAVLAAGWPESVTATTVDRQCGSSQQAVHAVAAGLVAGHYDVAVAGGVESMSRVPMGSSLADRDPLGSRFRARYGQMPNQGLGAELIADAWGLSRAQVDEYALRSHERAANAQDDHRFDGEMVPVETETGTISQDEGVRRGGTLEKLGQLKPAFPPRRRPYCRELLADQRRVSRPAHDDQRESEGARTLAHRPDS